MIMAISPISMPVIRKLKLYGYQNNMDNKTAHNDLKLVTKSMNYFSTDFEYNKITFLEKMSKPVIYAHLNKLGGMG